MTKKLLILTSLLISGSLWANIVNLECTYFESYNWKKSEDRKPPSGFLSLNIDESNKVIKYKGTSHPFRQKDNSIIWDVFYTYLKFELKTHLAETIELNLATGLLKQDIKTIELDKSIDALWATGAPHLYRKGMEIIWQLREIDTYKKGITHSANCSTTDK